MTALKTIIERYESIISFTSRKTTPPRVMEIRGAERRLGQHLPDDYVDFLLEFGCLDVEANRWDWPRPELFDRGPGWMHSYRFSVLGLAPRLPRLDVVETALAVRATGVARLPIIVGPRLTISWGDMGYYALTGDGRREHFEGWTLVQLISRLTSVLAQDLNRVARLPGRTFADRALAAGHDAPVTTASGRGRRTALR